MYRIRHYLTSGGKNTYLEWMRTLRDVGVRTAIDRRVNRIESGNFGDHKYCRDGVWELRIHTGSGFRVYYAIDGREVILLLCGGGKQSQSFDIARACKYWLDWQGRERQQ
jgi:putative addiction module killer protein